MERKGLIKLLVAIAVIVVVLVSFMRYMKKGDDLKFHFSSGIKSYTLKRQGDTLKVIENNGEQTRKRVFVMYRKGNDFYSLLLGRERLVLSNRLTLDTLYKDSLVGAEVALAVKQEIDSLRSSFIFVSGECNFPRIKLFYDKEYNIRKIQSYELLLNYAPD